MTGRRIRCMCGTVFDPSEQPTCPACGSAPQSPPTRTADDAGARHDGERDAGDRSFFERNRTLVAALGGAAGLLVVGLIARPFFDRPDGRTSTGQDGRASARQADVRGPSDDDVGDASGAVSSTDSDLSPSGGGSSLKTNVAAKSGLAAFEGTWRLLMSNMQAEQVVPGIPITGSVIKQTVAAAMAGPDNATRMTIDANGMYELEVDVSGSGLYSANLQPAKYRGTVSAQGEMTLTPNGYAGTERAHVLLMPVTNDMPHLQAKKGDLQMVMQGEGNSGFESVFWLRPGGTQQADTTVTGTWSNHQVFVDSFLPYRATLELRGAGDFRIRFTRSERGMLVVNDGGYEFRRSVAMGPPVQGRYTFDGSDRFTLTEPRGSATWERVAE